MTEKTTILLICYSFPPNKGIGGRRWAKFAKHLANKGYQLEVICKHPSPNERSEWTQDTQHPNIRMHRLAAMYPKILTTVPQTFFQKLEYRIWLLLFKLISKGTFPERTFFWRKQLLRKAAELIQEKNIRNVVVTVPPFRIGYYTSLLKLKFPQLNFILDYRDPWTDNKTFHGFMNLAPTRMAHELWMETQAIERANCVITANEQMTDWLKEKVPSSEHKMITIANGYDIDDIVKKPQVASNSTVQRFIYAGTFYSNVEYILTPFLSALKKQETADPLFAQKFRFDFYGDMDPAMRKLFTGFGLSSISLNAPIRLNEIQEQIQGSDFCLIFAAHDHSFAFNTKFYEYLANRKPIVIFSKKGEVPDFLVNNKLGVFIDFENFEKDFENLINNVKNKAIQFNSTFNTEQFSTLQHSKILIKQLI